MDTYSKALRLQYLNDQIKRLEAEARAIRDEILVAFPSRNAPYFQIVEQRRVAISDQEKAAAHYIKHRDHRALFRLSTTVDHFQLMGSPKWGEFTATPIVKVDQKALKAASIGIAA